MTDPRTAALAQLLHDAERTRRPIERLAPPGTLDIADAYAIQRAGRALRERDGARLAGRKVGLTSAAMQEMLGVDQPDFGYLTDAMLHESGARLALDGLIAPRVEAEIGFRLHTELRGPDVTREQVLAATEAVAPALEVIDSRIADWRIAIADTIADNASCGSVVLGEWQPLAALDLAAMSGTMTVTSADGARVEERGTGAAVLGHPADAIAWLARALHEHGGEAVEAGMPILPGAIARALPVDAGDRVAAVFDGLGTVAVDFHDEERGERDATS